MCLVAWPLNESEAGGDRNLFDSLMLISRNLHKKSSEVSIKRSPPASLSFKGQATKHYLKVVFLLANLNPDFAIENSIFCSIEDQSNQSRLAKRNAT